QCRLKPISSFRRHFCNVSAPPGFDTQRINLQYSGLNLNRYRVASPCRTICTVCGFVALS
ncbi:hypothetical protein, partial [Neisseria gonorrhoeae]